MDELNTVEKPCSDRTLVLVKGVKPEWRLVQPKSLSDSFLKGRVSGGGLKEYLAGQQLHLANGLA